MSYNLKDQVLQALAAMYSSMPEQDQLTAAANFLEQFQKQVEAWTIADQLLRDADQNISVKFFMAQTLRQKIKNQLFDLDTGARFSLRDSLMEQIAFFKRGPPAILTQLCLALASLIIQLMEWQDAVPQLIQQWSQDGDMCSVLLQLLTVLPQEVNSVVGFCSLTDEQFRQQAMTVLTNNGGRLLPLLVQFMQGAGNDSRLQEKVFSCLVSWLKSGDIAIMELKDSPLVEAAFNLAIQQPALLDMATEIICSMIYETREVQSCMPVVEVILPRLVQLYEFLKRGDHDDDSLQCLCRIFSEAGEAYLDLIIEHPQHFQPILQAIIECIRLCPIRSLSGTFSFWYSFSQSLKSPSEKAMFVPVFQATVHAIIGRLSFPRDGSDWTLEDEDNFRDFRHDIGDILKDCASVLGADNALAIVLELLQRWIQQHEAGSAPAWQELEAALFSIRAMGSEVRPEDQKALHGIMELFPRLPTLDKIRYTATLVLCRYAEWTRYYPDLLPFQLSFVAQGLDFAEVAPASCMALDNFGKYCGELLVPHLPELNKIYATYVDRLSSRELLDITSCIAFTLPWVPHKDYLSTLDQYIDPITSQIQTLVPQIHSGGSVLNEISFHLNRLHKFCENSLANVTDVPAMHIMQKLWPLVEGLLQHLVSHPAISESLCRLFRGLINSLAPIHLTYQPALASAFLNAYEQTGFSCYMWLLSKFIDSYYLHEPHQISDLLARLCQCFFSKASQCPNLDEIPHDVEEFSYMLKDAFKVIKADFFSLQFLPTLLQFYLVVFDMKEFHAVDTSLLFLSKLFVSLLMESEGPGKSRSDFPLVGLIQQSGHEYISRLITNIMLNYNTDLTDDGITIITLISELCPQSSVEWISHAFLAMPSHPFSAPGNPNLPSPPLEGLLNQLRSSVDQSSWRPFRRSILSFITRYRKQKDTEKKDV